METNTPIATTVSQSRRLLRLGLNPDTADMHFYKPAGTTNNVLKVDFVPSTQLGIYPSWSLSRLLSLLPGELRIRDIEVSPHIDLNDDVIYYSNDIDHVRIKAAYGDNIIKAAVDMLEWLIFNNYLNDRYVNTFPVLIRGRRHDKSRQHDKSPNR